jgi:hypothetical protein
VHVASLKLFLITVLTLQLSLIILIRMVSHIFKYLRYDTYIICGSETLINILYCIVKHLSNAHEQTHAHVYNHGVPETAVVTFVKLRKK